VEIVAVKTDLMQISRLKERPKISCRVEVFVGKRKVGFILCTASKRNNRSRVNS